MKSPLVSSLLLGFFSSCTAFSTLPNSKQWNRHASAPSARWERRLYSSPDNSPGRLQATRIDEARKKYVGPSLSTLDPEPLTSTTTLSPTYQSVSKTLLSPLLCALVLLLASPLPSNAGFGSGGASVSSFPEIKPLSTEEFLRLSPQKQRQREFSVSCFSNEDRYCKTGAARLYEEIKLFNSENEESLTQELKGLEQRALKQSARLDDEYQSRLTLEESLKQQTQLLDALGQQPAYVSYGAAAIGSIISTLIMHPIDTIKVQLMNSKGDDDVEDTQDDSDGEDEAEKDTKQESKSSPKASKIDFANAYKGILANILKEAPSSALYLGIYELIRTTLSETSVGQEPLVVYLIAGSVGEFFGSLMRAPAEAVKTRLQLGSGDGMTAFEAAEQVLFNEAGRINLFTSWSASLWRDIPMGAIQLAIFESVKTYVISSPDIELDVSTLSSEALFGALGGSVGAFVTTPADVITTVCINSLSDENLQLYRNKNPLEVLQLLHAEGGIAALFTGWRERILYWAPAIGIFLSIYCGTRQMALSVLV